MNMYRHKDVTFTQVNLQNIILSTDGTQHVYYKPINTFQNFKSDYMFPITLW